jgi:hypothetical protein
VSIITKLVRVVLIVAMALAVPVVSPRVAATGQDGTSRYQAPASGGQVAPALRLKAPTVGRPSLTAQAIISTVLSLQTEASALTLRHDAGRPPLALVLAVAGRSPPRHPSQS